MIVRSPPVPAQKDKYGRYLHGNLRSGRSFYIKQDMMHEHTKSVGILL